MKIFLLNPPAPQGVKMVREGRCMQREGAWTAVWAPISLTTMAALLEREGFETTVLDAIVEDVDFPKLGEILKTENPDVLVINTATPSITSDLSVPSLAKKLNSKIATLAFGIHVSALPKESLILASELDFVIRGEPEITLLEVTKALKAGKTANGSAGLSRREGKKIIHEEDRPLLEDLDFLPFPAWEKIDITKYRLPFSQKPFLLVDTGRGCPYDCKFCSAATFYGKKARFPSPKRVVDELEYVLKRFNVSDFLFWSESFTLNKQNSLEICQEILRRKLPINWVCNSRVDTVDLEQLKLLKKAGCWMIGFGVESGDNQVLSLMGKKVRVEQIEKAVLMAKKAGLEVTGHIILGFPGETKETIQKTIELACDLDLDFAQFYCAVPFPGSWLYSEAQKNGYLKTSDWSQFEQNFSIMDLPGLSSSQVEDLRSLAYRRFYLRPKMIFKTLLKLKTPRDFLNFLNMSKEFLGWI